MVEITQTSLTTIIVKGIIILSFPVTGIYLSYHSAAVRILNLSLVQKPNQFTVHFYHYSTSTMKPVNSEFFTDPLTDNHTVNIYSHLIGSVLFLAFGAYLFSAIRVRFPAATDTDIYTFAVFLFSGASCFALSATCHLVSNHSVSGSRFGTTLDYLGIVIFIVGSCVAGFYYELREHQALLTFYWDMVNALPHTKR